MEFSYICFHTSALEQVANLHKHNIFFSWSPEAVDYIETSPDLLKVFGSLLETQFGNAIVTLCIASVYLARWE